LKQFRALSGPSSRSDAFQTQNVLAKSALVDFDRELPHAWQRIGSLAWMFISNTHCLLMLDVLSFLCGRENQKTFIEIFDLT